MLMAYSTMLRTDTVCDSTGQDRSYFPTKNWSKSGRRKEPSRVHTYEQLLANSLSHCGNCLPFMCALWACSRLTQNARVILKIFTAEFYSIGALFAMYGAGILLISLLRRQQGNKQFFSEIGEDGLNRKKFRTSGNVVVVLTALSMAAYGCLLGLTLKLRD